ncbi:MAG: XRE family transcriptional regulator [Lachnospiraceae bacterium]|nr:XRE family transcriptional regulator [Lachnospiraceae bacterium]
MEYFVIDMERTGERIKHLSKERNTSVRQIQEYLGLESVQSVYDWFHARTLPTIDHLFALGRLWNIGMESILVTDRKERT